MVKDKLNDDEKEINKKAIIGQDLYEYSQMFKLPAYNSYEYDEIKLASFGIFAKDIC